VSCGSRFTPPWVKTDCIESWKVPVTYYVSTGCDMSTCSLHFQRSSRIMKCKIILLTLPWTVLHAICHYLYSHRANNEILPASWHGCFCFEKSNGESTFNNLKVSVILLMSVWNYSVISSFFVLFLTLTLYIF
jgi:hypothetical protein